MKNRHVALAAVLALAAAPALALDVRLDYDKDYDFKKVQTYQWIPSRVAAINPKVNQQIISAVDEQLGARGKRKVDADPDIYITYYANAREELHLNTTDILPTGWRSYYGTATETEHSYRVGTLIIDAMDARTNKLIWRGTAEDTINRQLDRNEDRIKKVLRKMAKEWDKRLKEPS